MNTDKRKSFSSVWLLSLVFGGLLSMTIGAQTPTPVPSPIGGPTSIFTTYDESKLRKGEYTFSDAYSEVKTLQLDSKLMTRKMFYRVVLPPDYAGKENETKRFPVIYLLHGLTGHFDNWTDKTKLAEYAAAYKFIIVTPEGNDGWYTDSVSAVTDRYESYIIKELIPEIDKNFRTAADRDNRAIAGLSMGGYGALKFGMKYPEMFYLAGSFSGALGAASITEKSFPGAIGKSIDSILGPADSDTRKANDLFAAIRTITPEKTKTLPFLYIDCGTEDFLFQNNRDFITLLIEKKVPHEYRQLPGAHDWKFWNSQVKEFLEVAEIRQASK